MRHGGCHGPIRRIPAVEGQVEGVHLDGSAAHASDLVPALERLCGARGVDPADLPMELVRDAHGEPVEVTLNLPGSEAALRAWKTQVGRVTLYLLDANVARNRPEDRELTRALYSGDQEMRIRQEIVLGIGGVRLLRALGIRPSVFHINEGHGAFAVDIVHAEGPGNHEQTVPLEVVAEGLARDPHGSSAAVESHQRKAPPRDEPADVGRGAPHLTLDLRFGQRPAVIHGVVGELVLTGPGRGPPGVLLDQETATAQAEVDAARDALTDYIASLEI